MKLRQATHKLPEAGKIAPTRMNFEATAGNNTQTAARDWRDARNLRQRPVPLAAMTHLQATFRQQGLSARVAELDLTLSRQRLGGEWLDPKNLRQHRPVALAARWRPVPKRVATASPDAVVGALSPRGREKSRAPCPDQCRFSFLDLDTTKCTPDRP